MPIAISASQLMDELNYLATFTDTPAPSVTRIVFSPSDLAARQYVESLCTAAGLTLRHDAVGNTFARWEGSDASLAPVGTGSHIDAIPHAGRYDGTVGVLGGLEAIRALQRSGARPRRSIELLLFTSEEPTRFGIGCLGSRLLSGSMTPAQASQLKDRDGRSLDEARAAARFTGSVENVRLRNGYFHAFLELHIEQGPLLEQANLPLGVVTAIAAPASFRVHFAGEGGHAGAFLMPYRRDAFLAAAELALAVESAAKGTGAIDTVGTAGVCEVFPGAINSVPSAARLELDVRDIDQARRDEVIMTIRAAADEIAARRGVSIRIETINADAPATSDPGIVETLTACCEEAGHSYRKLVSRAYHDSLFMAAITPLAMLFIRSKGGISHRPDEYSSPDDIAAGVQVLASSLLRLAG